MLYEGGEIDAHPVSLAQMTNSSTNFQKRNAAPLLYSICWQQLILIKMENVIELKKCITDFELLKTSDFENGVDIKIYSDTHDLLVYNHNKEEMDGTIFGLWIECGKEKEKTIMLDLPINELELFAKSSLNHIEIIRKSYGEQIKMQSDMGSFV